MEDMCDEISSKQVASEIEKKAGKKQSRLYVKEWTQDRVHRCDFVFIVFYFRILETEK
jgi:hypothetical protein